MALVAAAGVGVLVRLGEQSHRPRRLPGGDVEARVMYLVAGCTRSVREVAARRPGILGHMTTPGGTSLATLVRSGLPYAVDNGAFSGFDPVAFRKLLRRVVGEPRCLWVACPDRVGDSKGTLALFREWREEVAASGQPVAFVGQDGAEEMSLPWDDFACLFVGGSTRWKLSRAAVDLMAEAKRRGRAVHVGRVNSLRRMRWAYDAGADTVDGTSASRWGDAKLDWYCRWIAGLRRSPVLFGGQA
jgi:hypothetical protein